MAEQSQPVLAVGQLARTFQLADGQQLHAVGDVSFTLEAQSFSCIVGPSGCGKTTVLRMILGLDDDFQGTLVQPGRERVAAVFQEPRLLPWRTVDQNIRLVLPDDRRNASFDDLLDKLGLLEVRRLYPGQLSLGLARRVSLARAFILDPQLLILDEPFVSLDEPTAARLRSLLLDLWEVHQTTALMVTHDLREAVMLADQIIVLSTRPCVVLEQIPLLVERPARDMSYIKEMVDRIRSVSNR